MWFFFLLQNLCSSKPIVTLLYNETTQGWPSQMEFDYCCLHRWSSLEEHAINPLAFDPFLKWDFANCKEVFLFRDGNRLIRLVDLIMLPLIYPTRPCTVLSLWRLRWGVYGVFNIFHTHRKSTDSSHPVVKSQGEKNPHEVFGCDIVWGRSVLP